MLFFTLLGGNATETIRWWEMNTDTKFLTDFGYLFLLDSEKRRRVGSLEWHSSSGHRPQLQRHAVDMPEPRCYC